MAKRLNFSVIVPWKWRTELEAAFGPLDGHRRRASEKSISIQPGANRLAKFPVDRLVREVVEELRISNPVNVRFSRTSEYAELNRMPFKYSDVDIVLSTDAMIRRRMPELSKRERRAKIVSQLAEEACHYHAHNDCHDKRVVGCTLRLMRKHIPRRDLSTPYIKEKMEILRLSPKSPDRCPVRD